MKKEAYERFSGQVPKNFTDYSGRRIGCITVLKRIRNRKKETWYLLKCECGEEFETRISTLRRSKFIKCICGFENHSLKKTLQKMIHRCENKKDTAYKWYGAKNISIFEEWRKFPIKFIKWSLKNGWEKGLTIDRIDSYKNYCPENCQWITRSENSKKAAILRWAQKHTE